MGTNWDNGDDADIIPTRRTKGPNQQLTREERYVNGLIKRIKFNRRQVRRHLRIDRILGATTIVAGASVPVLASTNSAVWIIALFGSCVVVAEGSRRLVAFPDRTIPMARFTSHAIRELRRYDAQVGEYSNADDRLELLMKSVEDIGRDLDEIVFARFKPGFIASTESEGSAVA